MTLDDRRLVMIATVVLVVLRSYVFVLHHQVSFNADEAIVGLMAKHLSELTALPVFFYGQHYMLAVEGWLAALLFPFTGPTPEGLKLVMFGLNLAAALLLVHLLQREAGLRPWHAFTAALFFTIPPPGTVVELMQANGGNLEPFLYVLLLWIVRRKPVLLGFTFAVGFLNREFTIYGLAALLAIEVANKSLVSRAGLIRLAVAGIAAIAVFQSAGVLEAFASSSGPGTNVTTIPGPPSGLAELAARTCVDLMALPSAFVRLATSHLGQLFGARAQPLGDLGLRSDVTQGLPLLWPALALALTAALAVAISRLRAIGKWPWTGELQFGAYLLLVGLICAIARIVTRCGELDIMRYTLLALFVPMGILTLYLKVAGQETRSALLRTIMAVLLLWGTVSVIAHVRLIAEQVSRPEPHTYEQLTRALISHGIRYARANYWLAYHITFLSREQVIVDSTDVNRIRKYRWIVDNQDAAMIQREPCEGGIELVEGAYYACKP